MAKEDSGRGVALAILGIVAVIAVVGLVLLFTGGKSATGKAGDEQSYAASLGGRSVNTYQCPVSCGGKRGASDSVKCIVDSALQNGPASLEWDACPGTRTDGVKCWCPPKRPLAA